MRLSGIDIGIFAAYMLVVIGLGVVASRQTRRTKRDYLLWKRATHAGVLAAGKLMTNQLLRFAILSWSVGILLGQQPAPSPDAGIPAYGALTMDYRQEGRPAIHVAFGAPSIVSVATKPEAWGFFQFPSITRAADGALTASWSMQPDSIKSYGKASIGRATSRDGGKTWDLLETDPLTLGGLLLPSGDRIAIATPEAIKTEDLRLPKPVGEGSENYSKAQRLFYRHSELPPIRQGVFIKRLPRGASQWVTEHAELRDPIALRYSLSGLFPIVWWGDLRVAPDKSVIAGIYPGFQLKEDGTADPRMGVFFYRSTDEGRSWTILGRITYQADLKADPRGEERGGFTEPAFDILNDQTFLCVMRTSDGVGLGPMYASRSKDLGVSWTKPVPITRTGVLPQLLKLDNGVIVLSAGRPGVQLRFSDKNGECWTEAFEMLPYEKETEQVSCGYTNLIATGPDRFLLVYSDFRHPVGGGEVRKAINVREVIVGLAK